MIPSPYVAFILALAAFRLTRLSGWDDFPPIAWARRRVLGERVLQRGDFNARAGLTSDQLETSYSYRWPTLAHGVFCAYCAGMWWCAIVYVLWRLWPSWTVTGGFVLAMSGFVGTWARILDP